MLMRNGSWIGLFLAVFLFHGAAAAEETRGNRTLSRGDVPGQWVVSLSLGALDDVQQGVIVRETLPPGWRCEGSIPPHDSYNRAKNEIKWLSVLAASPVASIVYVVSAPPGEEGCPDIAGKVVYRDGAGAHRLIKIGE